MTKLNLDGQPLNKAFNHARLNDRKIDELIGLCKGIIADGVVNQSEAEYIQSWLRNNKEVSDKWPASVLSIRIEEMLKDNILDGDEQKELFDTLIQLTGGAIIEQKNTDTILSTSLPLTRPCPKIIFKNRNFCFTGKFATGNRNKCESIVLDKKGGVKSYPTLNTHYLVIGIAGSSDWIHSSYGRKIEKAVKMRGEGHHINIISEELWIQYI